MTDYVMKTKNVWKNEIEKNIMIYPDERLVAFLAGEFKGKDISNKKALDIGFGSGRNLIPLLNYGFECYGIDYNERCCEVAKGVLGTWDNVKKLEHRSLEDMEYERGFFDVIIVHGVIFLNKYDDMKRYLEKIRFVLKKGGKIIINFRTKEDFLYGQGTKIDNNTYAINDVSMYTFLDFEEAKNLLNKYGFIINKYEKIELWKNNLQDRHSWFMFLAEGR